MSISCHSSSFVDFCTSSNVGTMGEEAEFAILDGESADAITMSPDILCLLCEDNPKMKGPKWCSKPCGADVKCAENAARRESKEALQHFRQLKKQGGQVFKLAMCKYKASGVAMGRGFQREAFSCTAYCMEVVVRSTAGGGTKWTWMPRKRWIRFHMDEDDIDEVEASRKWLNALQTAKKGLISKDGNKLLVRQKITCTKRITVPRKSTPKCTPSL